MNVRLAFALSLAATAVAADDIGAPVAIDTWNVPYCELLLIHGGPLRPVADVYNTLGLGACDEAAFAALDADEVAKAFDMRAVYKNGPRAWVVSELASHRKAEAAPAIDVGGVEVRKVGLLHLTREMRHHPEPYRATTIERDTRYTYDAGRPIFVLDDPDGTAWVMQAYARIVDPELSLDDLPGLGDRLELPEGWSYRVVTRDSEFVVHPVDGTARIVQDDLQNTYDACFETACEPGAP